MLRRISGQADNSFLNDAVAFSLGFPTKQGNLCFLQNSIIVSDFLSVKTECSMISSF